jgi:predicted transcriptional regulator
MVRIRSTAPSGLHELRVRNRLRVIGSLREAGSLTQASIIRSTGLSRTTVSTVVHDLIKEGIIAENTIRPRNKRGGRPGIGLRLVDREGVESA